MSQGMSQGMSQPIQPPPLSLLRLREADIVRLCGLGAAAQGLDLLTHRALLRPRRDGARLSAASPSTADEEAATAWAELEGEPPAVTLRWGCSLHAAEGASGRPGCAHVAALLTAWVRAPADFVAPRVAGDVASDVMDGAIPASAPEPAADSAADSATTPAAEAPREARAPVQPRLLSAPRPTRPQTPLTLGDELRRLPAQEVIAIARRALGADLDELEARIQLESALSDRALVRTLLARLDLEAVETLAWARLAGGALTAADVDALATRAGRPVSGVRAALASLERHGLIFTTLLGATTAETQALGGAATGEGPDWRRLKGWRIAPETRAALPRELPIAPVERPAVGRARLRVETGSARALLLALALLARAPAPLGPLSAAGEAGETRRGRAGSALTPEDLPDAQARDLARGSGVDAAILRVARRTLLWAREEEVAQAVTDLARVPVAARPHAWRAGFRVWLAAQSPADLVDLERLTRTVRLRYDHTHEAFRPAALAEEAAGARAFVTRLVGQAREGGWLAIGDLLDLIWRVNPLFLRGRQQAYHVPAWRIERVSDGRPLRPTIRAEWDAAEGAYIHALLLALRWWGALDLASVVGSPGPAGVGAAGSAPTYFRLTALGRFLLGRADDAEAERRALGALTFDWGPIATPTRAGALATHPLAAPPALLDLLERWAQPPTLVGGRLIYSFGPDQACANFDRGLAPDDALRPLRALGLGRAAQTLAPRLEGWRAGYGDAHLTIGATLVEGRDEATLREGLAALPAVARRARWLSPTLVALAPADGVLLREALARKGWEL